MGVYVGGESEFYEFGISQIVEREKVGAGFFDGGTIRLQGSRGSVAGEGVVRCRDLDIRGGRCGGRRNGRHI